MIKKLLIVGGLIAVLLVGALVFAIARFDPEALGRVVLDRINASGTVEVEVTSFSLHPLKGLQLEDAMARGELSSGRFTASVDSVELEHEIWSLLRGELVVREILLRGPRVELVSKAETETSPGARSAGAGSAESGGDVAASSAQEEDGQKGGIRLAISRIRAVDCEFLGRTEGVEVPDLEIRGCTLDLLNVSVDPSATSALTGASATGSIRAESVSLSGIQGRNASGQLSLSGGQATIGSLELQTDNGELRVEELNMDLTMDPPPYNLRLTGDLDLNHLLEHAGDGGFGPGQLRFEGLSSEAGSLRGTGLVHLTAGDIPPAPLPLGIDTILQQQLLANVPYEATDVGFRIADDRVEIETFELVGPGVKLGGSGTLDLAGPLSLRLQIKAPRAVMKIKEIPKEVLDGLEDDQGWVTVPIRVGGSFEGPNVSLDREALEKAASNRAKSVVEGEAKKLGDRLLKKLFRDDKDDG